MSKQDRQGARTITDLERKYNLRNFGESFAEVMGIATDARIVTEELSFRLNTEVERIDTEFERVDAEVERVNTTIAEMEDRIVLFVSEEYVNSQIRMTSDSILLSVSETYAEQEYVDALLELKVGRDDNDQIVSMINASADVIELTSNRLVIESDNFSLSADGTITATNCNLNGIFQSEGYAGGEWGEVTIDGGSIELYGGNGYETYLSYKAIELYGIDGYSYLDSSQLLIGDLSFAESNGTGYVGHWNWNEIEFAVNSANLLGTWTSESSISVTSDANKKHDISDITEAYSVVFDNLKPRLYRYNDGKSGRLHVGFIAQEVEEAIKAAGLTTQDCAAFIRAEMPNKETGENETVCLLRYEEFIALLTYEIQKLKGVNV